MSIGLSKLLTERRNANNASIDILSTLDMLTVIDQEDQQVTQAITLYLPQTAEVVDKVATALQAGGRLIYIGVGTSGRLGILDTSECPPTFGTRPEQVAGIVAGGHRAILNAVENVEDNKAQGTADLQNLNFSHHDVLVGPAASGRTPYVIGAMEYAHSQDAFVAIASCDPCNGAAQLVDVAIAPMVGPEVVIGSTRLKVGTAQKLVLNMISTGVMIRVGKVYSNLMIDVEATNARPIKRQASIAMEAADCDRSTVRKALEICDRHCKAAVMVVLADLSAEAAQSLLMKNSGYIRKVLSNT